MDFISNARLSDDKNTHVWVGWKRFFCLPESISTWIVNHQILGRWAMFDSNCLAYLKSKSCALKPMLPPVLGSLGWIVPCRIRPVASCDDSWSGLQCHVEWSQSHHGGEMVYMVYGMKLQQVNIHVNSQDLKEKCVVVSKKSCKYSPWRIGEDGSTGGEKPPSGNSPCCWIGLCVCVPF